MVRTTEACLSEHFRFGAVELVPAERTLRIEGRPAAIGARAFDLLMALFERRDRVVTKNELLEQVWPGLVVEENNLQVQVSALRKCLGRDAIATIPGRGYRFTLVAGGAAGAASGSDTAPDQAAIAPTAPHARPDAGGDARLPVVPALVGRDDDLAALADVLRAQTLVTIVGPGGIGKTALAVACAHAVVPASPVCWVDLAPASEPALVASAVAQAIGLPTSARDDPVPALVAALAPRRLLLVLDNAEHQLDAVARLAGAVRAGAPGVRLLVTSQAPLKVDGERVFRLEGLASPAAPLPPAQAMGYGAVALFVAQATAADRRFALTDANVGAVTRLCVQLDGMALAIKLAAARLPHLGLQGLEDRLGQRLKLLVGGQRGAPSRHQTLLAALDWSHGLLEPGEQAVFRRLGVFVGGFTLDAAREVACDATLDEWAVIDMLGALVDRSLVAAGGSIETPRYRLHQSTREYALRKLDDAHERGALQRRHAEFIAARMDEAYEAYWSTPDAPWLDRYAPEIDNLRAAFEWSLAHDPALGVRLAGASSFLFMWLGLAAEARRRGALLEAQATALPLALPAGRFWLERSRLHWGVSDAVMHDSAMRAVGMARALADPRALYLALRCAAASSSAPPDDAAAMLAEMAHLEAAGWPPRLKAQRLFAEVSVHKARGDTAALLATCDAMLEMAKSNGYTSVASAALGARAEAALACGDLDAALRSAEELIATRDQRPDNFILQALATVAQMRLMQGDVAAGRNALADFIATSRARDWEWFELHADLYALLAAREARLETAARLLGYADAKWERLGTRGLNPQNARTTTAALVGARLDPVEARRLMADGATLDEAGAARLALEVEDG